MGRLLFLLAVVVAVYLLIRSYRKAPPREQQSAAPGEDMVRCAQCGIHLPRSEAIQAGGEFFCSQAHRQDRQA